MEKINKKLEVLHLCLCKESIPQTLPKELQEYTKNFEVFKEAVRECISSTDNAYITALRIFRDVIIQK